MDGEQHWRTADARLGLAFAEKVAGLGKPEQAKILAALRREQEAMRQEKQDKPEEAERNASEVLAVYQTLLGPETRWPGTWQLIGHAREDRSDWKGAKTAIEQALAIRRKTLPQNHPDLAKSLLHLGGMQAVMQDPAAGKKSMEEALAILRIALPQEDPLIASSLMGLGGVQLMLEQYPEAEKSFQEAVAILRKTPPKDEMDLGETLNQLGNVQLLLAKYPEAKTSFEETLAIRRKVLPKDHPDIARVLRNLGRLQVTLSEYAPAKKNLEEALGIDRKTLPKDHPDIAVDLFLLGNLQANLGEYVPAKKNLEEALGIDRKTRSKDRPDIAYSLGTLATIQIDLREFVPAKKNLEEALDIYRKTLPRDHPDIALGLSTLAMIQAILGEYAPAKKNLEEALAIQRKTLPRDGNAAIVLTLSELGSLSCLTGNDLGEAVPRLLEAADVHRGIRLRLAVAQAEQEQLTAAAKPYYTLSALLTATLRTQVDTDSVYARVVRIKGAVTAQQLWARQLRDVSDPETKDILRRLGQVNQQLVSLSVSASLPSRPGDRRNVGTEIRSLSEERAELERRLTARSPAYRAFEKQSKIGTDEVRAALPSDAALIDVVEYLHISSPTNEQKVPTSEQRLVAFVVRPGQKQVVTVPLGSSKEIADLVQRWLASYGAGKSPSAGQPDPAAELRKKLWLPLEKHLDGVKIVLVSPDGPLHGLPWAALPGRKDGTFLLHDYAFAVVPVPQLLPELLRDKPRQPETPAALVVGNVDFGSPAPGTALRFPPLPGTADESRQIADLFRANFPRASLTMLSGKDATRQAFVDRAAAQTHLHVATHGFFAADAEPAKDDPQLAARAMRSLFLRPEVAISNPAVRSGLVFAGANSSAANQGDAFLTALQVGELDLRKVDLVVLSACETGLGQVKGTEGVLGLQRAFQVAGTRAAVTSLWKVDDRTTQALMERFHRNLWEKHMGKLEALRERSCGFCARAGSIPS